MKIVWFSYYIILFVKVNIIYMNKYYVCESVLNLFVIFIFKEVNLWIIFLIYELERLVNSNFFVKSKLNLI